MKRILFITAFVPSRISAGENYSRQLINDISHDNKVDLIFFKYKKNDDYIIESKNVTVLRVFKNSRLIKLLNVCLFPFIFPLFSARFNLSRLLFIRRVLKKTSYDKVIFDLSQTFLFARFLKNVNVILNSHDVIEQRYSRVYKGFLAPFAGISERFVLSNPNATVFTLSEKDSSLIRQYYSINSIVSDVYLEANVMEARNITFEDVFVFFANWSRPDNSNGLRWFLKYVFPELVTQSKFRIIGPGLPSEIINDLLKLPNITYEGFMDNPYTVIANARALISPLFSGAGVKIKVIESLSCGTPVIGTQISFEGISDRFSEYNIIAETPHNFVSAISTFKFEEKRKAELKNTFLSYYHNKALSSYINS